jgi:hypothetical protein
MNIACWLALAPHDPQDPFSRSTDVLGVTTGDVTIGRGTEAAGEAVTTEASRAGGALTGGSGREGVEACTCECFVCGT